MRTMMSRAVAAIIAGAAAASAYAQQSPPPEPITVVGDRPAKKAPDPNEVICEKQQEIGSRIAAKRVCMTRGEWAEQRRLDRLEIDKAQTQRPY